jgi:prepilin-type N-terminal cleavage/methylation domain-containing protein
MRLSHRSLAVNKGASAESVPYRALARVRGAFSLVELIAVIALGAILATVAIVYVVGMVQSARLQSDQRTLANLNNALTRYSKLI